MSDRPTKRPPGALAEEDLQQEVLTGWVVGQVDPVGQAGRRGLAVRRRLLDTLGSVDRFQPFFARAAELVGLDQPALRRELQTIDGAIDVKAGWNPAPFPGAWYRDFAPGPTAPITEAGLVRMAPGAFFPRHQHDGHEWALILEGTVILDGRVHHPGDVIESAAGSEHEFAAGPARELVLLVGHGGVRFVH